MLREAYLLTVDTLAMAATSLLVVGLGAPGDPSAVRAKSSGRKAKRLFEILAWQNPAAARCLESLIVSNLPATIHTWQVLFQECTADSKHSLCTKTQMR